MRAVRQACGETFEEVEAFLKSETFPVVSDEMAFVHIWELLIFWRIEQNHICILAYHMIYRFSNLQIRQAPTVSNYAIRWKRRKNTSIIS